MKLPEKIVCSSCGNTAGWIDRLFRIKQPLCSGCRANKGRAVSRYVSLLASMEQKKVTEHQALTRLQSVLKLADNDVRRAERLFAAMNEAQAR